MSVSRPPTALCQALDHRFMVGMCADNQNSICNLPQKPSAFRRDERELYLQHSYFHTGECAGQLGIMVDARKLVPRIIESGIIQPCKHFVPSMRIAFADGSTEDHNHAKMRIKQASGDANTICYDFDTPESKFKSQTLISCFRPAPGGTTVAMVESTLEAKTKINADQIKSIRSLSLAMMPPLPKKWRYSYVPEGCNKFVSAKFSEIPAGKTISAASRINSPVAIWPNESGNMLFIALDGQPRTLLFSNMQNIWNGRERLQVNVPIKGFNTGEKLSLRYLVMLHPGLIKSESELAKICKAITGIDFTPLQGNIDEQCLYAIRLAAVNKAVSGRLNKINGKNPVPLIVRGLDDNKSSAIMINGKMRIIASEGGRLRTVIGETGSFVAGDLFLSDSVNLIAEYGDMHGGQLRLKVHNPLPYKLKTHVKANPAFKNLVPFDIELELAPGEVRWLHPTIK